MLEIACFSPQSAIAASTTGADRIELCENRSAGGTTPSRESVQLVKQHVSIPVFVMIRPRGGDFHYSDTEYDGMKERIDELRGVVDGFVFGLLDGRGDVDVERTGELVKRAHPLPCTFHRAFDEAREKLGALEDVIRSGCTAVLSSGGAVDAARGAGMLEEVVRRAEGRISVLVGGGVRSGNVVELQRRTGAVGFHSSAILEGGEEVDVGEVRLMKTLIRKFCVHSYAASDMCGDNVEDVDDEDLEERRPQ